MASVRKSGLYEYKVFGVIHGCPPDRCAEVYMDLRYRPKWDRYVKEVCEKIVDGRSAIYWEVKFPFPMTNRDYVFTRERRDLEVDGRKIYVILAKSVVTSKFPEKPGLIRVNHYKQNVAIESDGRNGSKIYMFYFENPGGKVPSWAVNWAAKTGVPNFVKDMQKACLGYQRRRSTAHQM
ncbi:phosphatidylcholine transfer protein isoform X2 [Tiliqua scincoides]|uniref:phosphatidylcholine transfer protein isoform X2 n=1 Tax=Tiliqua scincoides TaxID=71010 RepID=UPI00346196FE